MSRRLGPSVAGPPRNHPPVRRPVRKRPCGSARAASVGFCITSAFARTSDQSSPLMFDTNSQLESWSWNMVKRPGRSVSGGRPRQYSMPLL
ncbi:Uncharacterised protein [Bordetella pertussis]|nr:Uncharacterised protein [Bordetella pertussis]CFP60881.1 Uncharacterised protein [Bordetella pertussis]